MNGKITRYTTIIVGLLLLVTGLFLVKSFENPQGIMRTLPYVCIGIGCGLFVHGMGDMLSERALRKAPETQKQMEIEKNDERNIALADKAKGKAFDMMTFVFGTLMVSFALMGVDVIAVLLLVFSYLFVHGSAIYYRYKLDREM